MSTAPVVSSRRRASGAAAAGSKKEAATHRVHGGDTSAALDRLMLMLAGAEGLDDGMLHVLAQPAAWEAQERAHALRVAGAALGVELTAHQVASRAAHLVAQRARAAELIGGDRGVAQRTGPWYEARQQLITASDAAQALGASKFGTQRTFFQKKCGAAEEQQPFDATLPPLKWGVMFEPVAQAVYSARNQGVRVHEFGLMRHPTVAHIGASPDGITDLGVMLELKCPWRRVIVDGELPMQYYYQIQAQLEVCGLDECDYCECEFGELFDGPDDPEWAERPDGAGPRPRHERGLLVELPPEAPGQPPRYLYPPSGADADADALRAWALEATRGAQCARSRWWVLRRCATSRVRRDPAFVQDMLARLAAIWERVRAYRDDRELYLREVGAPSPAPSPSPAAGTQQHEQQKWMEQFAFVEDDD